MNRKKKIEKKQICYPADSKTIYTSDLEEDSLNFINSGLACHALTLLEAAGILKILIDKESFPDEEIQAFNNPALLTAAFMTLKKTKLLKETTEGYQLTKLGKSIAKKIGYLTFPLIGYRKLFSKQFELLNDPKSFKESDIDFSSVAFSSISFGEEHLDPLLIKIFLSLNPKGTICDLGCGTCEKLAKICKATNSPGLGIDHDKKVIKLSKKYTKKFSNIEAIQGKIEQLDGIWEDVAVILLSQIFHDLIPKLHAIEVLASYKKHFPRLNWVVIADIVSPSNSVPTILPGFDYVHGLQGFISRTYEENYEVFEKAGYTVMKEYPVPNMPNFFIWILFPNR